jgi:glutathione S-transferase
MSLKLYYHPLSSYCWKALIALYEHEADFTKVMINLGDPNERAALLKLSPIGKFPVLVDEARGRTLPESSIIIEYLDRHHAGATRLLPADPDRALAVRQADRFYDLYVHTPMQKITIDRMRPEGHTDPQGIAEARAQLGVALGMIEADMASHPWAAGESFSMADCAAAPPLFYVDRMTPLRAGHPAVADYLDRLKARPSIARVIAEAEPYFHMVPKERTQR